MCFVPRAYFQELTEVHAEEFLDIPQIGRQHTMKANYSLVQTWKLEACEAHSNPLVPADSCLSAFVAHK